MSGAARRTATLAVAAAVVAVAARAEAPEAQLTAAAQRLLEALPPDARHAMRFPFDDRERQEIRFAPLRLNGLRVGDLGEDEARLVDALLAASLSRTGLEKVRRIRALEDAVRHKEQASRLGWLRDWMRDPGRYFLALFGEPGDGSPWGYRFEGHHVSLHLTVAPGEVPSNTPLFLGAEPRIVPEGAPGAGTQALRDEEERARALYGSLTAQQRAQATLAYASGRDLLLSDERKPERPEPVGLARAEMDAAQQAGLDGLLDVYLDNFAPSIAARRRAGIDAASRDAIRFAWAQGNDPPNAFYYRIQGPAFLIELDNTTDGDHLHAVWRDFAKDWGADLLALHYDRAHGTRLAARRPE